jgi:hypothetical protein
MSLILSLFATASTPIPFQPIFSRYPDSYQLKQIPFIPGTHASGNFGPIDNRSWFEKWWYPAQSPILKHQIYSIRDQLLLGIRFFEFRVHLTRDNTQLSISGTNLFLTDPLEQIKQFLIAHPDETVMVYIRPIVDNIKDRIALINKYSQILYPSVDGYYLPNPIGEGGSIMSLTIGDLKGKMILFHDLSVHKCYTNNSNIQNECISYHIGQSVHITTISNYSGWRHDRAMKDIKEYCESEDRDTSSAILRPISNPDPSDYVLRSFCLDNIWHGSDKSILDVCQIYNGCFKEGLEMRRDKGKNSYVGIIWMDGATPEMVKELIALTDVKQ